MAVPHRMILRIGQGIADHFPIRVSEWIMTLALIGWAVVLGADHSTFDKSPSFVELARWGDEIIWSMICWNVAMLRLTALVVNGTFKQRFPYSPHLRGFASLVACIFWGQIVLGILISTSKNNAESTGLVVYGTFMALDVWNMFRAWVDVGIDRTAGREMV